MRRREFITGLVGAATAWPVIVRAQPPGVPVIGFLNQEASELTANNVTGFRKGLSETGFIENQNATIEYRWGEARYEQLPQLAAELVNRKVAVIASAFFPATLAAKRQRRRSRSCSSPASIRSLPGSSPALPVRAAISLD